MAAYDLIAAEYYSEVKHGACRNFRQASETLVKAMIDIQPEDKVLEVGAGMSFAAPLMKEQNLSLSNLCLADSSDGMLSHSEKWRAEGATLLLSAAEAIPLADKSINIVISLMGDPYNNPLFWLEMSRVLSSQGQIIMTVPAYQWNRLHGDGQQAIFTTEKGKRVSVPSFVFEYQQQVMMVERVGFLLEEYCLFSKGELQGKVSKAFVSTDDDQAIVEAYLFQKAT